VRGGRLGAHPADVEETGADGVELNFGCPHGMSERGMGSAVGQVPEYIEMVARWCKAHTRMPVIVKLTPNITDIRFPARAAKAGGADAVSLINTVSSITGVDLDSFSPEPSIDGKGSHGGYCGPAVKPIALNMVAEIARDPETRGLPISGIGGVTTWRDAAEFLALGAGNVQVCTAAMTYGFGIIKELTAGCRLWMDEKGFTSVDRWWWAARCPMSPTGSISTSTTSPRRASTRTPASSAGAAMPPARTPPPGDLDEPGSGVRGDRRRMRGLQPVRQRLPGGGLHHHGAPARRHDRSAHRTAGAGRIRQLDDASEQPDGQSRRIARPARATGVRRGGGRRRAVRQRGLGLIHIGIGGIEAVGQGIEQVGSKGRRRPGGQVGVRPWPRKRRQHRRIGRRGGIGRAHRAGPFHPCGERPRRGRGTHRRHRQDATVARDLCRPCDRAGNGRQRHGAHPEL
jgi:hypothetical protein